ncbi:toxin-antitoxin system, antitoxin component, ribbon-helix-helix domain protein [Ancylostoma caninum]|uniref:Toxin-antitoxin system, antitoxin component, ribbon-helix-helix domain protein n=1 Tax=Ancylostoma caninum TaxID=29170 RepID=A0A368F017_ANCCA|nr:toxin-antitoxin system, antitoxin component, ribbon-helix-helix domain protein [Ancylostoma caninum]
MLEQRRLEVQRRRAEMERRRAELIARQEARKDYEAERARDLSEMLDTEDPKLNAYRKALTPEQFQQYL